MYVIEGVERVRSMPAPAFPTTSTPVLDESPMKDVAKRMFFETLDLVATPNEGSSRPKPMFMDDLELSAILHRVFLTQE